MLTTKFLWDYILDNIYSFTPTIIGCYKPNETLFIWTVITIIREGNEANKYDKCFVIHILYRHYIVVTPATQIIVWLDHRTERRRKNDRNVCALDSNDKGVNIHYKHYQILWKHTKLLSFVKFNQNQTKNSWTVVICKHVWFIWRKKE